MSVSNRTNRPVSTSRDTTDVKEVGQVVTQPTSEPSRPTVGIESIPKGAPAAATRAARGVPADFDAAALASDASGVIEGMSGAYAASASSRTFMGYGDIANVKPTAEGFSFDINLYTAKSEDVVLILQLPVLDPGTGHLTFLNLDVLTSDGKKHTQNISAAEVVEPKSQKTVWGGVRSYSFSLQQINEYLRSTGLGVELKPGDQLSISGIVAGSGHRVMNAATNTLSVPRPLAAQPQSAHAARLDNLTGQSRVLGQDLPLDIAVKLSDVVLNEKLWVGAKNLRIGEIIKGELTTRLESEYKGSVTEDQMKEMITNAYSLCELSEKALAGDAKARKELDETLGKDVVLRPVNRHWLTADGTPLGNRDASTVTLQRDENGWPLLDPMHDDYADDKDLNFSRASGACRVRSNAQKEGHAEFKLNGGALDPATGIRQRVEIGLSLVEGATAEQLAQVINTVFNRKTSWTASDHVCALALSHLGYIVDEAEKAGTLEALTAKRTPWAEVTQIRHKFELANTRTGTKVELSLDKVDARTMRPEHAVKGRPQERTFYVIESELDHLQLDSANVVEAQQATTKAGLINAKQQADFISETRAAVQSGGLHLQVLAKPQLHSVDHVKEGSFRGTASYKEFERMQAALLETICGDFRPGPARQKSAHFAELIGVIPPENTVTV